MDEKDLLESVKKDVADSKKAADKPTQTPEEAKVAAEADALLMGQKSEVHSLHRQSKIIAAVIGLILMGGSLWLIFSSTFTTGDTAEQNTTTRVDDSSETATQEPVTNQEMQVFASSYHQEGSTDCPVAATFIDVTKFDGPGDSYPDPSFSVTCTEDTFTVTTNNIPHTEFVQLTPGDLEAQDYSWTVTRNPQLASSPTYIGENASNPTLGDLGFAVNGVVFYGPTEGAFPDPYGDPAFNNIVDDCGGHHVQYHYHAMDTTCFFPDWTPDKAAPIVGYALDGFPIYGSTGCLDLECSQVITMKSSYNVTGDLAEYAWDAVEFVADQGDEYLDECNGRTQPDGSYGYHITDTFPYIIGCFMGVVDNVGPASQDGFDPNAQAPGGQQGGGGQGQGGPENGPPQGGGGQPPQ